MKLTREELAEIRSWYDAQIACRVHPYDIGKLLGFADEMLPLRDALVKLLAAEAKVAETCHPGDHIPKGSPAYEATDEHIDAHNAFWQLARELVERETET